MHIGRRPDAFVRMSDLCEFQSRPHPINGTLLPYFMIMRKMSLGINRPTGLSAGSSKIPQIHIISITNIADSETFLQFLKKGEWKIFGKRRPSCIPHDAFTGCVNSVYPNLIMGDKWDLYICTGCEMSGGRELLQLVGFPNVRAVRYVISERQ